MCTGRKLFICRIWAEYGDILRENIDQRKHCIWILFTVLTLKIFLVSSFFVNREVLKILPFFGRIKLNIYTSLRKI